jgi:hypothetical protein
VCVYHVTGKNEPARQAGLVGAAVGRGGQAGDQEFVKRQSSGNRVSLSTRLQALGIDWVRILPKVQYLI